MRNIHKKLSIVLIFMLIRVFFSSHLGYSSINMSLRVPVEIEGKRRAATLKAVVDENKPDSRKVLRNVSGNDEISYITRDSFTSSEELTRIITFRASSMRWKDIPDIFNNKQIMFEMLKKVEGVNIVPTLLLFEKFPDEWDLEKYIELLINLRRSIGSNPVILVKPDTNSNSRGVNVFNLSNEEDVIKAADSIKELVENFSVLVQPYKQPIRIDGMVSTISVMAVVQEDGSSVVGPAIVRMAEGRFIGDIGEVVVIKLDNYLDRIKLINREVFKKNLYRQAALVFREVRKHLKSNIPVRIDFIHDVDNILWFNEIEFNFYPLFGIFTFPEGIYSLSEIRRGL